MFNNNYVDHSAHVPKPNNVVQHFCSPCVDALYRKPTQVFYQKEPAFKPERFTKKTDVDTWWTRFELYLKTVQISQQNLRTIFLGFLDDECIKTFNNCTPRTYLPPSEIYKQMKKLFGKDFIDRDAALEKFYNRKPGRDEQMTDFFPIFGIWLIWHMVNHQRIWM